MSDERVSTYSVSVVIPAYNVQEYIAGAIDSVLSQSHAPDEIIVVDDGSTDGTADIIKKYGSKVRYIYQENRGGAAARNTGIAAASSEWIAFLDADDKWYASCLDKQLQLLRRHRDILWSYSNFVVDSISDGRTKLSHNKADYAKLLREESFFESYFSAFASGVELKTSVLLVSRSLLKEAGMFDEKLKWAQDADLAFRLAYKRPKVGYISEPLCVNQFGRLGSITQLNWNLMSQRCDFIDRHLRFSTEYGMSEEFVLCGKALLKRWVRAVLEAREYGQIDEVIARCGRLLSMRLILEMRIRKLFPRFGSWAFDTYFKLKRFITGR